MTHARRYPLALRIALNAAGLVAALVSVLSTASEAAPATVVQLRCPRGDRHVGKSNSSAPANQMVPRGATNVLVCRYRGNAGARADTLVGSGRVTAPATVRQLARDFNKLASFPASQTTACPNDTGAAIISYFHYRTASDDPVVLYTTGCAHATNGYLLRSVMQPPGPQLIRKLKALSR